MLKMFSHQRFDNILIRNERDPPDDEDEEEGEKREREKRLCRKSCRWWERIKMEVAKKNEIAKSWKILVLETQGIRLNVTNVLKQIG